VKRRAKHCVAVLVLGVVLFAIANLVRVPMQGGEAWYWYPLTLPLHVGSYFGGSPYDYDGLALLGALAAESLALASMMYFGFVILARCRKSRRNQAPDNQVKPGTR